MHVCISHLRRNVVFNSMNNVCMHACMYKSSEMEHCFQFNKQDYAVECMHVCMYGYAIWDGALFSMLHILAEQRGNSKYYPLKTIWHLRWLVRTISMQVFNHQRQALTVLAISAIVGMSSAVALSSEASFCCEKSITCISKLVSSRRERIIFIKHSWTQQTIIDDILLSPLTSLGEEITAWME